MSRHWVGMFDEMILDPRLSALDLRVFMAIMTHDKGEGSVARPGITLIAKEARCKERAAQLSIASLKQTGYLNVSYRFGKANVYTRGDRWDTEYMVHGAAPSMVHGSAPEVSEVEVAPDQKHIQDHRRASPSGGTSQGEVPAEGVPASAPASESALRGERQNPGTKDKVPVETTQYDAFAEVEW